MSTLPICPILSITAQAPTASNVLCVEEQCAWYIPQVKKCAVMMLGYESAIRATQQQAKK